MVFSHSLKIHDFRFRFSCFSISIVYPPNSTLGVVIQYGKWSAQQGASFEMVSSHSWKNSMIFCFVFPASVFRLFTHQTRHLVLSFNMENDQRIKARLLAWFPTMFEKHTDFRLQYFRQLAIDFPIKRSFGICSKQLLAMKNSFLTLPKPEKLHFVELLTI